MVLNKCYIAILEALNTKFNYITEREGYKLEDTWVLHSKEVIEKLKEMDINIIKLDNYLSTLKATVPYITFKKTLRAVTIGSYEEYHKTIRPLLPA